MTHRESIAVGKKGQTNNESLIRTIIYSLSRRIHTGNIIHCVDVDEWLKLVCIWRNYRMTACHVEHWSLPAYCLALMTLSIAILVQCHSLLSSAPSLKAYSVVIYAAIITDDELVTISEHADWIGKSLSLKQLLVSWWCRRKKCRFKGDDIVC